MIETFDPYHKWLGIPPAEQPPNHYRLLGIAPFEPDADVIDNAASRQMAHLRTFQIGSHQSVCQQMLNEVAKSRMCLLNPASKTQYDQQLHGNVPAPQQQLSHSPSPAIQSSVPELASAVFSPAKRNTRTSSTSRNGVSILGIGLGGVGGVILAIFLLQQFRAKDPLAAAPPMKPAASHASNPPTPVIPSSPAEKLPTNKSPVRTPSAPSPPQQPDIARSKPNEGVGESSESSQPNAEPKSVVATDVSPESTSKTELPVDAEERVAAPAPRLAIPSAEEQRPYSDRLQELYRIKELRSNEDRCRVARELFKLGQQPELIPAERFTVLRTASTLARDGEDPELMIAMANEIAKRYDIDIIRSKTELLVKLASNGLTGNAFDNFLRQGKQFAEDAFKAERYEEVQRITDAVFQGSGQQVDKVQRKQLMEWRSQVKDQLDQWNAFQLAEKRQNENAEDKAANLVVGKWYCLERNDWERGLNHLAKGADDRLAKAADLELKISAATNGERVKAIVKAADAWYEVSRLANAPLAFAARGHYWYSQAEPEVSGIEKQLVSKRIAELAGATYTDLGNEFTNSLGLKMIRIPAGEFLMGSPKVEEGRRGDEQQHRVRITKNYYLGATEVTVGMFKRFVTDEKYKTEAETDGLGGHGLTTKNSFVQSKEYSWRSNGFPQTDEHPVVNVSWNDAVAFCAWLSKKEGKQYRLPTEAEWEYACRAGSQTRFPHGDNLAGLTSIGNFADNALKTIRPDQKNIINGNDGYACTAPVGKFKANKFGLHDLMGNVWEWCSDWYEEDYAKNAVVENPTGPLVGSERVTRGGGWMASLTIPYYRSATRTKDPPTFRSYRLGFRVALSLSPPALITEAASARSTVAQPTEKPIDVDRKASAKVLLSLPGGKLNPSANTGIVLEKGAKVEIHAKGSWKIGRRPDHKRGPEVLIIAIGESNQSARVTFKGAEKVSLTSQYQGKLFLGIDDDIAGDNSGELDIHIHVEK